MGLLSMITGATLVMSALLVLQMLKAPKPVFKWGVASLILTSLDALLSLGMGFYDPEFRRRFVSLSAPSHSFWYFFPTLVINVVMGGVGIGLVIRNANHNKDDQSPSPNPFDSLWFSIFVVSVIFACVKAGALAIYSFFGFLTSSATPYQPYHNYVQDRHYAQDRNYGPER